MDVVMISPGFPAEMPLFTRGLAEVGARVLGLGDQPEGALAEEVRECLTDYLQVRSLWDEEAVVGEVHQWLRGRNVDRVECLWEPGMILAGYFLAYPVVRFLLELVRDDPEREFLFRFPADAPRILSTTQTVSLLLVPLAVGAMLYLRRGGGAGYAAARASATSGR